MSLEELRPHLFTLPEYPDWIPYRNSYYTEDWGFCLSHKRYIELKNDVYEVVIDSSLEDGYLTYGECYLEGDKKDEVLISSHICHPSLCNDNLSGVAIATFLARYLSSTSRRHSYRFLFLPTTIGSITWLALNETKLSLIKHGLVLACLGDSGISTYKKSRLGNTVIDRAAVNVLTHSGKNYKIMDFLPYGYDERQFCSPGFNLPIGCFMRTPNGCFPEYHTSADNLDFVQPDALYDSFLKCTKIINILDNDSIYMNQNPKCEPHLGKRGLYRPLNQQHQLPNEQLALLWVLNLSDGNHSLLDISERAGMSFEQIKIAADILATDGLLIKVISELEEKGE
jgi:aminopeptidase-like protein